MIEENPNRSVVDFRVSKFEDIIQKIIPLFNSYSLKGGKLLDYMDFCKAVELMKNKAHLTVEGIAKIRYIKAGLTKYIYLYIFYFFFIIYKKKIGREDDKS